MEPTIVNKVSQSGITTIDLTSFLPKNPPTAFDMAAFLYMGIILREKDFREAIQSHDWEAYRGCDVAVFCSADAIVPHWAYMLVASRLSPVANEVYAGTVQEMEKHLVIKAVSSIATGEYVDARVVVKGCGDRTVGEYAYLAIAERLTPHVKSLMYGEPCSTVPVFKRK